MTDQNKTMTAYEKALTTRQSILDYLNQHRDGKRGIEIGNNLNIQIYAVYNILGNMIAAGELEKCGKIYHALKNESKINDNARRQFDYNDNHKSDDKPFGKIYRFLDKPARPTALQRGERERHGSIMDTAS